MRRSVTRKCLFSRQRLAQLKHGSGDPLFIPAGMPAISRWLSAATPPEQSLRTLPHPGGMPEMRLSVDVLATAHIGRSLPSLQDGLILATVNRWYRCAQPPANFCDPCWGRKRPHTVPQAVGGMRHAQS